MNELTENPEFFSLTVPPRKNKERIDKYLVREIGKLSRSRIKTLIDEDKILVNDNPVKTSYMVNPGDIISATIPPPVRIKTGPENIPLNIIYEDPDILIVNKPAGMVVHPAFGNYDGTLVNALLYHIKDLSGINGEIRPGIVHRLDKDTTGVIIVAKHDVSHRGLSYQFSTRKMQKVYLALAWHHLKKRKDKIEKPLLPSRKDRSRMVTNLSGKESVTYYEVKKEYEIFSLVEVYPKTGRTHQIRAHLSSIGNPIVGDEIYGGRNRQIGRITTRQRKIAATVLELMPRQALHAWKITLTHPVSKEIITFEAPIPEDIEKLLRFLDDTEGE